MRIIKSTLRTEVLQLPTNVSCCVVLRGGVVAWGDHRVGWIMGCSCRVVRGVSPHGEVSSGYGSPGNLIRRMVSMGSGKPWVGVSEKESALAVPNLSE